MSELYKVLKDNDNRIFCQDYPTDDNLITIEPPLIKYVQGDDIHRDDFQELQIGMDSSGVGYYYFIKTDRWAFDDIDSLIEILNDYKSRFTFREIK